MIKNILSKKKEIKSKYSYKQIIESTWIRMNDELVKFGHDFGK